MGTLGNHKLKFKEVLTNYNCVLIDTNSFIYYMEDHDVYAELLEVLFDLIETGCLCAVSSTLLLTEVLTKPIKDNNKTLTNQYIAFLSNYPNLKLFDIDKNIAILAAKLRAKYSIKTPDSIFLATALEEKTDVIITNDIRLKKITEIDFIILDDFIGK